MCPSKSINTAWKHTIIHIYQTFNLLLNCALFCHSVENNTTIKINCAFPGLNFRYKINGNAWMEPMPCSNSLVTLTDSGSYSFQTVSKDAKRSSRVSTMEINVSGHACCAHVNISVIFFLALVHIIMLV